VCGHKVQGSTWKMLVLENFFHETINLQAINQWEEIAMMSLPPPSLISIRCWWGTFKINPWSKALWPKIKVKQSMRRWHCQNLHQWWPKKVVKQSATRHNQCGQCWHHWPPQGGIQKWHKPAATWQKSVEVALTSLCHLFPYIQKCRVASSIEKGKNRKKDEKTINLQATCAKIA